MHEHQRRLVYGRKDTRGLLKFVATSLAFTIRGVAFAFFAIAAVVLFLGLLRVVGLEATTEYILDLLRWPAILIVIAAALAVIYRFGPSRDSVDWRWIAFGSAASLLWVCASLLFSWAISWLGTLDELYGSVGAMIGSMLWIWLSVIVVLIGAELGYRSWPKLPSDPGAAPPTCCLSRKEHARRCPINPAPWGL